MAFLKKQLIHVLSKTFNWYFDFYTGGKKRPVFFEIDDTSKDLRILEKNFNEIRLEVKELVQGSGKLKNYHEIDPLQHNISAVENPERNWKVFMLYMMGDFS